MYNDLEALWALGGSLAKAHRYMAEGGQLVGAQWDRMQSIGGAGGNERMEADLRKSGYRLSQKASARPRARRVRIKDEGGGEVQVRRREE